MLLSPALFFSFVTQLFVALLMYTTEFNTMNVFLERLSEYMHLYANI